MARVSISSAEFQKGFGRYREVALKQPLVITNHGRDSLVRARQAGAVAGS